MKLFKKAKETASAAASAAAKGATSVTSKIESAASTAVSSVGGVASSAVGSVGNVASSAAGTVGATVGLSSSKRKLHVSDLNMVTTYVPNVSISGLVWLKKNTNEARGKKKAYGEFLFNLSIEAREITYRKLAGKNHNQEVYGSIDLAYLSGVTKLPSAPSDAPTECAQYQAVQLNAHKEFVLLFETPEDANSWVEALNVVSTKSSPKNPIFSQRLNEFLELDEQERGLISTSKFRSLIAKSYSIHLSHKTFSSLIQEVVENEHANLSLSAFFRAMDFFFLWESSGHEFEEISRGEETITIQQFHHWLAEHQKEKHSLEDVRKLAAKLATDAQQLFVNAKNYPNHLDVFAFHQYYSAEASNSAFSPRHATVYQDMTQPFAHYFCNSSHNTYLLGDQLKGKSSTQAYVIALLKGCRCVELDTWDGPNNSPIVTHGNTLCTKISLQSVIETVKEYAFKSSPYPVILSIENHCSLEQQDVMAAMFKDILGPLMPEQSWFWSNPEAMPSPEALKNKILLKGACQIQTFDEEDEEEEENAPEKPHKEVKEVKEIKVSAALSSLIHLSTKKLKLNEPGNSWEMSSFSENGIGSYAKNKPNELVKYLQRQLLRIYPKGTRVDSSNYMPLTSWNVGAQIVALNFQDDEGKPLHLNQTKFSDNGGSGYLLKPQFMLQKEAPRSAMRISSFPETILLIEVVAASRLPTDGGGITQTESSLIDPYVLLELFGAPKDEKRFKSKIVMNNGYNPTWREQFCFPLYYPELALLYLTVKSGDMKQASGKSIAASKDAVMNANIRGSKKRYVAGLPVSAMREGSRVITLKNKKFEPLQESKLIVNIRFYGPK
eukprot:TRINITY_DN260_c0_g4_i1.p1 TRINITY_DN260_c0_g4~~TRINITY_DN260_c0_g4_i1.p1  ORF type:complete len:836 (-),score=253.01 TRINITY_DN260_c0_g4_i1:132-2639(-)